MSERKGEMSFWDHLEELRGTIFRSVLVVAVLSVILFFFKDFLFEDIILAPTKADFFIYRLLKMDFSMPLVNLDISAQFFIHLKVTLVSAFILGFPLICLEIWKFIAPALYRSEKKAFRMAFLLAAVLFYMGLAVGYCFVLPVTLNFFMDYTVSGSVENTFSLTSYISMFSSMVLMIGIVFEFPAVIAVLSKVGIVTKSLLKRYRRHAFCAVLIVSAAITPSDPFSMMVVAVPLYALYELSVLLCRSDSIQTPEKLEP